MTEEPSNFNDDDIGESEANQKIIFCKTCNKKTSHIRSNNLFSCTVCSTVDNEVIFL
jgi:hypothetical protein